jgi:uncharacterized protein
MKFQPESASGVNVVSRHQPGCVWVGPTAYEHALLLPWTGTPENWGLADFEGLTAAHFERIAALSPEVVIFGSGPRIRFPHPSLTRALIERRIGIETMDTAAACRTYNVLVTEGRSVVAALMI